MGTLGGPEPSAESPMVSSSGQGVQLDPEPAPLEWLSAGRGARGADIVRQEGSEAGTVVILLHGWLVSERRDYRAWAAHLARRGQTVILPRYQRPRTPPDRVLGNTLRGVRSALDVVGDPESLVAAGHSAGAALAVDYAARAAAEDLPAPEGILAIYPGRAILGYPEGIPAADPAQIDRSTRLVVMSSPIDAVVGEQPAIDLLDSVVTVPNARKRLISVSSPRAGDHYAPARASSAARRTFWTTLDRLVARVQRGG